MQTIKFSPNPSYVTRKSIKIRNPDQTGYVKGRYIGENIRLIQDLMFYTKNVNIPVIAIFIDFRKAYDTIEWNYLEKSLHLFNFEPDILQWLKILHNNVLSCVLNNGHASLFLTGMFTQI